MQALLHSMAPNLQQVTSDPRLCRRLLDNPGQVWVSLLWGHCSFLMGLDVHKVLFVPSKSLFPQSCLSSGSYGGVNDDLLLQEGLRHAQVFTQSPCPCGSPLLTHTSTGDTQIQFCLSLCGISGLKLGCISEGALLILSSGFRSLEHVNTVLQEFQSVTYHMLEA